MKKLIFLSLVFSLAACATGAPEQIVVTATSPPTTPTFTPLPTETATPLPTNTPEPTPTPLPTDTPVPQWDPVDISQVEAALSEAGYSRYPFTNGNGVSGFNWVDRPYEYVTTWEDGRIELEVLHDKSPILRMERMEEKFAVLDEVMPPEFMAQLREETDAYNNWVPEKVTGKPDYRYAAGDAWQTVWAEYFTESTSIGSYDVWFHLSFWQSTCPPQYSYCYYENFPGLEFTGDSSFTWYTILIRPNGGQSLNTLDA
jgi:hypothetical protein